MRTVLKGLHEEAYSEKTAKNEICSFFRIFISSIFPGSSVFSIGHAVVILVGVSIGDSDRTQQGVTSKLHFDAKPMIDEF